jgi:polyhydroxybutyrate depolymerase
MAKLYKFQSVEGTIRLWAKHNDCPAEPVISSLPDKIDDGCTVKKTLYGPGREDVEVVLYTIVGGGHTWPGRRWSMPGLGATTRDISANDLMWEFFLRHPMR